MTMQDNHTIGDQEHTVAHPAEHQAATDAPPTGASRRHFLTGSAKVLGGSAALLAFGGVGSALASPKGGQVTQSDLEILNFALTLEHLEAAFYVEGLARFSASDFTSAAFIRGFGPNVVNTVRAYFKVIRDHELHHVRFLKSTIESAGGTPVTACRYDFGYTDINGFVQVAQALENTGVMAYDGALANIQKPAYQTAGATIATVEARHAAYLNLLNGMVPFPEAFDEPKTQAQILAIAGQFIVGC
jgi:rubrerythrin